MPIIGTRPLRSLRVTGGLLMFFLLLTLLGQFYVKNANPVLSVTSLSKRNSSSALALKADSLGSDVKGVHQNMRGNSEGNQLKGIYSKARTDRSGSAILDMMYAHSYAFHNNMTYLGACWTNPEDNRYQRVETHQHLLIGLGLAEELKFACPANFTDILDSSIYTHNGSQRWSSKWLAYIRSRVNYPERIASASHQTAVHIRRGDVDPCTRGGASIKFRYLTNAYYQAVIDTFVPTNSNVTIYSQLKSYESLGDFQKYSVFVNTSMADTWREMMTADTIILSRSSFSFVPAILNKHGTVLYAPFWIPKANGWKTVPENITKQSDFDSSRLRAAAGCGRSP